VGLHPFHDTCHKWGLVSQSQGDFCYSANTLPLRKLEHLTNFKPLILTNTPAKLRSSEVSALINYVACLLLWLCPPPPPFSLSLYLKKLLCGWWLSYSGGRDQEDCSLKPAWAKQFARPYLEKPYHQK
jgi:hypothetical protein